MEIEKRVIFEITVFQYQKSMNALSVQAAPLQPPLPPPGAVLNTAVPPPLPADAKPPLPPTSHRQQHHK